MPNCYRKVRRKHKRCNHADCPRSVCKNDKMSFARYNNFEYKVIDRPKDSSVEQNKPFKRIRNLLNKFWDWLDD